MIAGDPTLGQNPNDDNVLPYPQMQQHQQQPTTTGIRRLGIKTRPKFVPSQQSAELLVSTNSKGIVLQKDMCSTLIDI